MKHKSNGRPGRPHVPQKRLGKHQARTLKRLLSAIRRFAVKSSDANRRETAINNRLIRDLQKVDDRVVNKGIASVSFVGETYRPECTITDGGHYVLLALECKRLRDRSAKRLFKEGLSQAHLYLTRSKAAALVLYDFTAGQDYKRAFGAGNSISSRMASRLRDDMGLYVIVLTP